jgi:Domain of unknown function DUF29
MKTTRKIVRANPRRPSISVPAPAKKELEYDKDFYKWTSNQAKFLKKREFLKLDIDNLIEEIESLGRSERRTLESHLVNLFLHLLKIKYQPGKHTRSWDLSIKNAEYHAKKVYSQNPSLKQQLTDIFKDAYYTARLKAIDETGLEENVFPEDCLWKIEEILDLKQKKKKHKGDLEK